MKQVLFTLLIIISTSTIAQNHVSTTIKEDIIDIKTVIEADSISYFGFDFSNIELVNSNKIGTEKIVEGYIYRWLGAMDFKWNNSSYMSWMLRKEFTNDYIQIQNLFENRKKGWITAVRHPLTIDSIQNIVSSYPIKKQDNKIGLVIIVETLIKHEESGIVNYVFFDIESRKVLWRSKISSVTYGYGMTNRWANAISTSTNGFCSYYANTVRKYKKKNKKEMKKKKKVNPE